MTESDIATEVENGKHAEDVLEDDSEPGVEYSEGDDDDHNSSDASGGESGSKKKKKKKKKKRAAKEESPETKSGNQQAAGSDKPSKEVTDKRFTAALEALRNGGDLWVDLSNINLHDGKTKKVVEALKNSISVTALDLSGNCIGDAGAQAIASVLGAGGGTELIELDLRGNNFSGLGQAALEGLKKLRKQLKIKTGSLEEPEPSTLSSSPFSQGGKSSPIKAGTLGSPKDGQKMFQDLTQGPMFKKYFQTGEDDEDDNMMTASGSSGFDDASMMDFTDRAEELWDQLKEALNGSKDNVPAISSALWTIYLFLEREVSSLEPPLATTAVEGLKPHIRQALQNLPLLDSVLQIVPDPVTVQFSSVPQPAVGSHRLWASEVLALLLHLSCIVIDQIVANTQLVLKVLELALRHPLNNALHARTLRILQACLRSQHRELWEPLLEPQPDTDTPKLLEQVAQIVTAAKEHQPGKRTANVGFALDVTRLLHDCCSEAELSYVQSVSDKLQAHEAWTSYWESSAAQDLWKEHEGVLGGGERPKKYDSIDDQKEMEARIISGHKLLSILQGMNAVAT